MLKRFKSLVVNLVSLPLYWFSFVVPRNNNIWIFGAWFGHRYTDNSKWVFESVCRNEKQIRAIWLTHEKSIVDNLRAQGYEAYLVNSIQGYWYSCRAGLIVSSSGYVDVNRCAISRAKKIQLWHGSPMKKIGYDDKYVHGEVGAFYCFAQKIWRMIFPFTLEKWDAVVACSEFFRARMASAYRVDPIQVKVTGYPRNDILLKNDPPKVEIIDKLKTLYGASRVIIYAPTFRNTMNENVKLFETFNADKIESILNACDAVLLIKFHYACKDCMSTGSLGRKGSRIYWLKEEDSPEINPLLNYADLLITDYSGVYFDFLLLDKPIVFAPFDLKEYLTGNREMYEEYDDVAIAGPQCVNWIEVMAACSEVINGEDRYCKHRKLAQQKYNDFIDDKSSQRVIVEAKKLVGIT